MAPGIVEGLASSDRAKWGAIEEIFFSSLPDQTALDAQARHPFFRRWTDYYRHHEPEQVLFYELADRQIAGYLTGCLSSRAAKPLFQLIESYGLFESYFDRFPAHFHVNCRPTQRGRGIGTALVRQFLSICRTSELPGVHVVTAVGARNITFYRRLGFAPLEERRFAGINRLLLGLSLD